MRSPSLNIRLPGPSLAPRNDHKRSWRFLSAASRKCPFQEAEELRGRRENTDELSWPGAASQSCLVFIEVLLSRSSLAFIVPLYWCLTSCFMARLVFKSFIYFGFFLHSQNRAVSQLRREQRASPRARPRRAARIKLDRKGNPSTNGIANSDLFQSRNLPASLNISER